MCESLGKILNLFSTILVAEDDPNDTLFFEQAFAEAEVKVPVRFVNSGKQLLDYVDGKPPFQDRAANPLPSLLILDLKMPAMDGFEVLDWRQHHPELRQIPVVVFSGLEGEADMRRAYALGANLYLTKPHKPSLWAGLLKPLVDRYVTGASGLPQQQDAKDGRSPPSKTDSR